MYPGLVLFRLQERSSSSLCAIYNTGLPKYPHHEHPSSTAGKRGEIPLDKMCTGATKERKTDDIVKFY